MQSNVITSRFTIGNTLGGWEVIDRDGRSVSPSYEAPTVATNVCDELNSAAAAGPRALATALGAIDE